MPEPTSTCCCLSTESRVTWESSNYLKASSGQPWACVKNPSPRVNSHIFKTWALTILKTACTVVATAGWGPHWQILTVVRYQGKNKIRSSLALCFLDMLADCEGYAQSRTKIPIQTQDQQAADVKHQVQCWATHILHFWNHSRTFKRKITQLVIISAWSRYGEATTLTDSS